MQICKNIVQKWFGFIPVLFVGINFFRVFFLVVSHHFLTGTAWVHFQRKQIGWQKPRISKTEEKELIFQLFLHVSKCSVFVKLKILYLFLSWYVLLFIWHTVKSMNIVMEKTIKFFISSPWQTRLEWAVSEKVRRGTFFITHPV